MLDLDTKMQKRDFLKNKQFIAMVSVDDLQEVVRGLFKELIIGPLKPKMAEIRISKIDTTSYFLPRVVRFGQNFGD